ncbi:unnamed protein product [Rotaria socialis]|uniref:Isochorismatase-like domain-containing protein n=2 Tax=Rotaria socialis TaxID=392032 RepID=A0A821JPW4_9BILA|nr:unnamed protein product [Rotaria socialis]CAF3714962.1 unnamed protein product [Rotaria socialis]CAF3779453.1 unnamed protein product [Rotaria socialis]CAF4537521.1 unnamed protein product [Rotaria socialis]CAF4722300.1 unnamed protein product [Rotaria socialis]
MEQPINTNTEESDNETVVIGSPSNFWRFSSKNGFDLTRGGYEGNFIRFETTKMPITIDPARSALVIIDMQNFFLNPAINSHPAGLAASQQLLDSVLPTTRKIAMQVIWLNWGLTQEDIDQAPPSVKAAFQSDTLTCLPSAAPRKKIYKGFGTSIGEIKLPDGKHVEGGRLLMRDTWNASLYDPLLESYNNSQSSSKPDQLFHKARVSGLWSHESPILSYLQSNNIVTLFFAGVNTDQCVSSTLQDALSKNFDCVLLRDACGTSSPSFAQQCIEYNCALYQGFVMDVEMFSRGVHSLEQM